MQCPSERFLFFLNKEKYIIMLTKYIPENCDCNIFIGFQNTDRILNITKMF